MPAAPDARPDDDADAIVVGAGHNGLITAAYLARAGLRTILLEARAEVGGTAASERFAGATVNICNCDHTTFRTTPVIAELELARFGLRYLDVEPSGYQMAWSGGPAWSAHHSLEQTLDSLRATYPDEVDAYRRYAEAAVPAAKLILAAAAEPPSPSGLTRRALRARLGGVPTLLRWSRRSAADVLRSFFRHDALLAPAVVTGPMVWGISPETPRSGLGALTYAMRHVGTVGRPIGGSGMVPTSILAAFEHHGGVLRTKSEVDTIVCEGDAVRGVALADGTVLHAPIVVSACNPHDTFLRWLTHPPAAAADLVRRWRDVPHGEGYESKIDAILTEPPHVRAVGAPVGATLVVGPSLADIDRGARMMASGEVLDRPAMLVNVPTLLDPSMAPTGDGPGRHVFSLEALYTPYRVRGGWPGSAEPWRWLERFADLCEPGFLDSIVDWRAMTPDVYEREFFLPAGHATSFAGGPLAAFRNPNPELTRYETAVRGLYLTGAATFPGAGVWGASGKNCATVVLSHVRATADR
jgi:beta-carotene ketolase (CrtO type)